ncbi:MAG TPA: 3'-5' exonuclease [Pseudobdellovibrionaceae bacterium]|nr:3'-5' exonuclease [Pseudobdellovibrionaceae bacterium]
MSATNPIPVWQQQTWIAIDTETTGQYWPQAEICEIAAVKWRGGEIIERYQSLVKPTRKMSDFVIGIHGITNEAVEDAPPIAKVLPEFFNFIHDGILLAHHAQFDLAFIACVAEECGLVVPPHAEAICTSLLGQKLIPKGLESGQTENHRLQTLKTFFKLEAGPAHRADSDAELCLLVAMKLFERLPPESTVREISNAMKRDFGSGQLKSPAHEWKGPMLLKDFGLLHLRRQLPWLEEFVRLSRLNVDGPKHKANLDYNKLKDREIYPIGVIPQMAGHVLMAYEAADTTQAKRFYLNKVQGLRAI